MLNRIALLIPPIRRLHAQRNRLLAVNESISLERAQLQERVDGLDRRVRELETLLHRATALNNAWHTADAYRKRADHGKAFAIVCSAGRTATQWLADAFNLHPRVFFSHGPDLEPRKKEPGDDRNAISERIMQQINSFDWSKIDAYFDLLQKSGDYVAYGNIHGLVPSPAYVGPAQGPRDYYMCALYRHPVARVQSFVNKWRSEWRPAPSEDDGVATFYEANREPL